MTPLAGRAGAGWTGAFNPALTRPAPSPLLGLGFVCFCFYVFAFYSRVLDMRGARLHLPAIAFGIAILVAVLSGRIIEVLQDRIAVYLVGLSCWLVFSIPAAYWRGGSFTVVTQSWIPAMLLFLVAGAVIATVAECRRCLYVVGLAIAVGALLVILRGRMSNERLELQGSRYANSNTIAIMLLMGLPMVWLLAAGWRAGLFRKVLVAGVSMVMLVALLLTGSREGLIGLAVLCLIAFVRSSLAGKAMILIAVVAMLAGAVLFLPKSLKSRFATIFHSGTAEMQVAQTEVERKLLITAGGSFQGRRQVLLSSLKVTMRHPLLGVGPGNFAPYMADQAKSTGTFALWVGTHNTYTQLSSEAGIPALCLFVAALVSSMRALGRIYRRGRRIPGKEAHDIASMALALHTSFVAFCVCGFFNHMAYEVTIPLMAGITVAMTRTASKELNRLEDVESRQEVAPESSALVLPHRSRFVAG